MAARRVALAAALAVLALLAPAAQTQAQQEQQPSIVLPGSDARIAVDGPGDAHLTWVDSRSGQDETIYCRASPGATRCSETATFSYPQGPNQGLSTGAWPLLPGDGRTFVLDSRCCTAYAAKFLYTSINGGESFGPGTQIGEDNNSGADIRGDAQYVSAGSVGRLQESILTFGSLATVGLSFQAMGTTGPPERTTAANVLTQNDAASGTFGLQGNTLVAAWWRIDDGTVYWRAWNGSGDVNDQASWTPIAPVAQGTDTRIAGGEAGIFLAYLAADRIVMHEFTGSGWSAPITLSDVGTSGPFDIIAAPGGGLHFVWRDANGDVRYRESNARSPALFSDPVKLQDRTDFGFRNPRLGVGGDSRWLAWEDSTPGVVHAAAFAVPPPPPTRGETVNAVPVKGRVLVKLPRAAAKARGAQAGFVPLESIGRQLPVGSVLDTGRGTVRLTAARTSNGTKTQNGRFNGGVFSVDQGRKNPLTTLSMRGGGLSACSRLPRGGARKAGDAPASTSARRRRRLFGNARGRFRTRGRNSVASVRGTRWSMTDSCRGTLTRVTQGTVIVRDLTLRRNRRLRAGDRYLAKPPRRRRR